MKRPISISLLLFFSYFLQAQNSFSSLYYSSRLKANTASFLPILSEEGLQNSFLGFTASPLISYTQSFGESDFDYHSFGFSLAYKGNSKLSFSLDYEKFKGDQTTFVNNYLEEFHVFPGRGEIEKKGEKYTFKDFNYRIAYNISNHFDLEFGQSKHFIGDGYRSLLLSDNAFNYPFLRIQTSFWRVQYTNLYAEMQDINYFENNGIDHYGYAKKYMSSHYLSTNVTSKLNIGIFESVIWRVNHAPGVRGFDVNYLNPIALFRPLEYSINSPDNALVGINAKYELPLKSYLYGQLVLDEFSLNEMKSGDDWYGSKYGYQLGAKMYDAIGLENLTLQAEYNLVRPYTYAHHDPRQNYAHYNQPLAHPLGANFSEKLFIINYRKDRWVARAQIMIAKYGDKIKGDPTSFGNDVYMSTGEFEEPSGFIHAGRPSDFGIAIYQGNLTDINYLQLNIGYLINPATNFKIDFSIVKRDLVSEEQEVNTMFYSIGLKTDLFNHYYDF